MNRRENEPSLRQASATVLFYVVIALLMLWVTSWEPHIWGENVLRGLAYFMLVGSALWFVFAFVIVVTIWARRDQ